MRRVFKFAGGFAAVVAVVVAAAAAWLTLTAVSAEELPPLKSGDIVFQYSGSSQSLPILLATRSPYTHMGIVDLDRAGGPYVIEAGAKVTLTPLAEWIDDGSGLVTVKRFEGLGPQQITSILEAAYRRLGKPYDIFFLNGEDQIYCSELVQLAYRDGAGVELGTVERVADLDIDYAPVRQLIESRWRRNPLCKDGKAQTFEQCYGTILQQSLISPASIARDPRLTMVFSNFGPVAE